MGVKLEPAKVARGVDRPGQLCACGDHAFATLTKGYSTIVSPEDINVFVRKWSVRIRRSHVAAMRILHPERTSQLLHRLIIDAPSGKGVDHINGDPLDNRRGNLRLCDQAQNSWNRGPAKNKASGLPKGVMRHRKRFAAKMKVRGQNLHLGTYDTPEEADLAYRRAAEVHHGEFRHRLTAQPVVTTAPGHADAV